jgi:HK97 gp10 family phage protein
MLRTSLNKKQFARVMRNVETLTPKMKKKAEFLINASALKIESDAKNRVPVDSGRLRSSLKTEKFGGIGRRVYTNVEYAPYVEFGTRSRVNTKISGVDYSDVAIQFKKSNGGGGGVRPRPYLFPAFEAEKPNLIKNLKRLMKNG